MEPSTQPSPVTHLLTSAPGTSRYLRTEQVAEWISVSPRVVRYWMKKGVLPYHKVGRVVLFKREAVEAAIDQFEIKAVTDASARIKRKRRMVRLGAEVQP